MPVTLYGTVRDGGRLTPGDVGRWRAALRSLDGHAVVVTVAKPTERVTLEQHRYYRGVVLPMYTEAWNAQRLRQGECELFADQVHSILKMRHDGAVKLPPVIITECMIQPERWEAKRSMRDFSMSETSTFIDAVRADCWDSFGIRIPESHEERAPE